MSLQLDHWPRRRRARRPTPCCASATQDRRSNSWVFSSTAKAGSSSWAPADVAGRGEQSGRHQLAGAALRPPLALRDLQKRRCPADRVIVQGMSGCAERRRYRCGNRLCGLGWVWVRPLMQAAAIREGQGSGSQRSRDHPRERVGGQDGVIVERACQRCQEVLHVPAPQALASPVPPRG